MKNQLLLAVSAIAVLTVAAVAEEGSETKKDHTCTTTVEGGETKTTCTSGDGKVKIQKNITCKSMVNGADVKTTCTPGQGADPVWEEKDGPHVMIVPSNGQGHGDDVNVQVFNDGKTEKRIMIVRHGGAESADANKDGKVSRKEFLARAEKHFAEMDKNGNGSLEGEELHPPMPTMPPGMPPLPPVPPVPPVPPAPPAPPAQN